MKSKTIVTITLEDDEIDILNFILNFFLQNYDNRWGIEDNKEKFAKTIKEQTELKRW